MEISPEKLAIAFEQAQQFMLKQLELPPDQLTTLTNEQRGYQGENLREPMRTTTPNE